MPAYDDLVARFDKGDVLFGLSDDLQVAERALNTAYADGATFWNNFSRAGRSENKRSRELGAKTDIFIQSSLTNAVADPGELGEAIKATINSAKDAAAAGLNLPDAADPVSNTLSMPSIYQEGRVLNKLPNEHQRGVNFAKFLEGHDNYSPNLMGGSTRGGAYQRLGAKESDRDWIAQSRRSAFEHYLIGVLDKGGPEAIIHLKNGESVAARGTGANSQLVSDHWQSIDWSRYDMWDFLHTSHLANVVNYKMWQRTSKAGLEFQTTIRNRDVHFLLDTFLRGNNMDAVVNKSGGHGRSITAGELRWLYRNWENPRVSLRTIFWTTQGRVAPPWHLDRHLWSNYVPRGAANRDNSRALAATLEVYN